MKKLVDNMFKTVEIKKKPSTLSKAPEYYSHLLIRTNSANSVRWFCGFDLLKKQLECV